MPTCFPHRHKLEQSDVCHIGDAAFAEARKVENEMLVIMDEKQENQDQHDISNASFQSSFSRLCSYKLNDMGYHLNRISPITFDGDVFQTPNNRTQGRAPTSTPRKKGKDACSKADPQGPPMNKTFPVNQAPRQEDQPSSKSYDAEMSVGDTGTPDQLFGCFVPPQQTHPNNNHVSGSSDDSQQQHNQNTIFNVPSNNKTTGTDQPRNAGMQMSPSAPAPTGVTEATQMSPKKTTSSGGTQTTPPCDTFQDQGIQGQPDCNHDNSEDQQAQDMGKGKGKGKKNKRKLLQDANPHPGTSYGGNIVPRSDFTSRNLGTGRPPIQCTACGEYTHWRRECPYDNYCTTCNNHDHVTHMCRAPRHTGGIQQDQQSPSICVYCGRTDHSSAHCHNRPWDNREQPCSTPDALKNEQN